MEERGSTLSVAEKKGTKMAAKWSPARGVVRSEPFPLLRSSCPERPGAVKGAPLLGAAKRTLEGEDPLYTKANFRRMAHRPGTETCKGRQCLMVIDSDPTMTSLTNRRTILCRSPISIDSARYLLYPVALRRPERFW